MTSMTTYATVCSENVPLRFSCKVLSLCTKTAKEKLTLLMQNVRPVVCLTRRERGLWFSWPSIYRITYWNLVDYTYHRESLSSGLFTKDMKKKAAYHALDRIINHEWRTHLCVKADEQGKIVFCG